MSVTVKGCGNADWIRSIPLGARRRRCCAVCVDCDEDLPARRGQRRFCPLEERGASWDGVIARDRDQLHA
jgi:hypothetical protein